MRDECKFKRTFGVPSLRPVDKVRVQVIELKFLEGLVEGSSDVSLSIEPGAEGTAVSASPLLVNPKSTLPSYPFAWEALEELERRGEVQRERKRRASSPKLRNNEELLPLDPRLLDSSSDSVFALVDGGLNRRENGREEVSAATRSGTNVEVRSEGGRGSDELTVSM